MIYRSRLSRTQMNPPRCRERATPPSMTFEPSHALTEQVPAQARPLDLGFGDYYASEDPPLNVQMPETNSRHGPGGISLDGRWEYAQQVWNPVTPFPRRADQVGDLGSEMATYSHYPYAPNIGMSAEVGPSRGRIQDLHRTRNHPHQPQQPFNRAEVRGNGLVTPGFEANRQPVPATNVSKP